MKERIGARLYRAGEEIAHAVTHGIGVLLAITGAVILTVRAAQAGGARRIAACAVFGATLVLLYAASTLYHGIPHPPARRVLRVLDHSAIYLLIAGTYTPFTLITLRGAWGWSLFGVVWGLALAGIVLQFTPLRRVAVVRLVLYVVMGWAAVAAFPPLLAAAPTPTLLLLLGGGLAYTGGIAFYLWSRLPYHHAVWHLFVLAGSTLHFFAVLSSLSPPA